MSEVTFDKNPYRFVWQEVWPSAKAAPKVKQIRTWAWTKIPLHHYVLWLLSTAAFGIIIYLAVYSLHPDTLHLFVMAAPLPGAVFLLLRATSAWNGEQKTCALAILLACMVYLEYTLCLQLVDLAIWSPVFLAIIIAVLWLLLLPSVIFLCPWGAGLLILVKVMGIDSFTSLLFSAAAPYNKETVDKAVAILKDKHASEKHLQMIASVAEAAQGPGELRLVPTTLIVSLFGVGISLIGLPLLVDSFSNWVDQPLVRLGLAFVGLLIPGLTSTLTISFIHAGLTALINASILQAVALYRYQHLQDSEPEEATGSFWERLVRELAQALLKVLEQ